jgi:hypothetical protein
MARGTSAEERREAVTIIEGGAPPDDVDDSFDQWRDSLADGQVPGKVTAYQIPMDDHGVPQPSAKNQIRLGAWPSDAYDFDGLCALLIREYMTPEKILCVRLMGTKAGEPGLKFNKVVTLRAPNTPQKPAGNGANPESAADLMKAIQENNERMLQQFRALLPAAPQRDADGELERMLRISAMINAPNAKLMELLIPALVGRPAAPAGADPFNMLSGLVDVFGKLQDLRGEGGGGGEGSSGNDFVDVLKAIVPIAKPALEALPAIMADRARNAPPVRALPPGAPRPQPRPPVAPGAAPTQPQPQPAAQAAPPPAGAVGDIPSGDQQMFAELKPQIDALVSMAAQGSDPDGAADILFDQVIMELPDEYYEKLADLIGGQDFVTKAAVFNPAVNTHAEWFKRFQARIVARYNEEDQAATARPTILPVPPAA